MKKRAAQELFKNKAIYIAYLCTIGFYCLLCAMLVLLNQSEAVFLLAFEFLDVPYAILGAIEFAVWCRRDIAITLGIVLGSLTPLILAAFI